MRAGVGIYPRLYSVFEASSLRNCMHLATTKRVSFALLA